MGELVRMSELDAVNSMLAAIGELPITTLEEAEVVTMASTALLLLQQESRNVQSLGLNCNREYNFLLTREEGDKIPVPANTLNIDPMDPNEDYVIRGTFLYDKGRHTYLFDKDVEVEIILFLPFDDLPNHVQVYIIALAQKTFQKNYVGSDTLDKMARETVFRAQTLFNKMEERNKDVTMLACPAVARTLRNRRRWR